VKLVVLSLLLLKATATSFGGLSSIPVVRDSLVVRHTMLTDRDLNLAVTVGRSGPGPNGLYVVSVGYLIAGVPGACVGWLAMITPAFLVIGALGVLRRHIEDPRLRSAMQASAMASAGLMLAATLPLARGALTDTTLTAVAAASFAVLSFTRVDSFWLTLAAGLIGALRFIVGFEA